MRVLITEPLSEPGLQVLREAADVDVRTGLSPEELMSAIGAYDALVVRSATQVTASLLEAGCRLRVVGRAGTGVDNIDVDAATRRGIVVVNAPAGNSNAVAEHTIALMLALARRIYPAVSSFKAGRWEKRTLQGFEIKDKTLGLVGLGRIGMLVASKSRGLEMRVIAHDPYVSPERAASSGVELASLEEVLSAADFVSVHTPLSPATRGMIGARELALLKPTAYLLNCARGGIVDEEALREALERGVLAGAALDVFEQEPATDNPLIGLPNVIATPHLGASTAEAQEHVALDVARSVVDVLAGRIPEGPVNLPYVPPKAVEFLQPYIDLATRLGSFFVQWRGGLLGRLELVYEGEICEYDTRVLTSAFLAGLLAPVSAGPVNLVNASQYADERGLVVSEARLGRGTRYGSLITARFAGTSEPMDISGALIQGEPHLVGLDGQRLDCVVQGCMLVDLHHDRPGIVGRMGQILGQADINIGFVQMSRVTRGGASIMILGLDECVPADLMPRFLEVPNVQRVRMVTLPPYNGHEDDAA
ncbi:MAG TPA: phosphoglycerate dehydrogenase [Chloroflexi bacterium]|jgi:D-3-phosphoglycerate dehydrogenase|nr:phosphoglycerate dehydrogenase [Chloroflexota bacterium]